jgi:hypothetical protein
MHQPARSGKQTLSPAYKIRAKVWQYPGPAGWHFVTLSQKQSREIKSTFGMAHGGWGSLRVEASIGETRWQTSLFPDKKSGAYLLPSKAGVRNKERIQVGSVIGATIRIRM